MVETEHIVQNSAVDCETPVEKKEVYLLDKQTEPKEEIKTRGKQEKKLNQHTTIDNVLYITHPARTNSEAEKPSAADGASCNTIISCAGETRRPLDGNRAVSGHLSGVGANRIVPGALVKATLLDATLAIGDQHVAGEEFAGIRAGQGVAHLLATRVIEDSVLECRRPDERVGLSSSARGSFCLDGAVTNTILIIERPLSVAGEGSGAL